MQTIVLLIINSEYWSYKLSTQITLRTTKHHRGSNLLLVKNLQKNQIFSTKCVSLLYFLRKTGIGRNSKSIVNSYTMKSIANYNQYMQ